MNEHAYKEVVVLVAPNELQRVNVDWELVDLVQSLCALGWTTCQSCQDNYEDRVWLCFNTAEAATSFLKLIANKSKFLSLKVRNATTERYDKEPDRWVHHERWWVDSFVHQWEDDSGNWTGEITIEISVRFPRRHLEEVISLVLIERAACKEVRVLP